MSEKNIRNKQEVQAERSLDSSNQKPPELSLLDRIKNKLNRVFRRNESPEPAEIKSLESDVISSDLEPEVVVAEAIGVVREDTRETVEGLEATRVAVESSLEDSSDRKELDDLIVDKEQALGVIEADVLREIEGSVDEVEKIRKFSEEANPDALRQVEERRLELEMEHEEKQQSLAERAEALQEQMSKKLIEASGAILEIEDLTRELEGAKTSTFKRVISFLERRSVQEKLGRKQQKLSDLQKEFDEIAGLHDEVEQQMMDTSKIEEAERLLKEFYSEQKKILEDREKDRQARDVSEVSKKYNAILTHSFLSVKGAGQITVMKNGVRWRDMLKSVLAFDPPLSTSSVRLGSKDGTFSKFGVLLGGGEITDASFQDAGSTVVNGKKEFIRSADSDSNIESRIERAVSTDRHLSSHNEIGVKEVKIAGLFMTSEIGDVLKNDRLTESDNPRLREEILEEGKKLGIPVYYLDTSTGNFYVAEDVIEETVVVNQQDFRRKRIKHNGEPVRIEDILKNKLSLSPEQKLQMEREVLEGDVFNFENDEKRAFDRWQEAKKVYKGLVDGGPESAKYKKSFFYDGNQSFYRVEVDCRGISDYLDWLESAVEQQTKKIENIEKELEDYKNEKYIWKDELTSLQNKVNACRGALVPIAWHAWGVAEEAGKAGDTESQKRAEVLASKYVTLEEKQGMLSKRLAENGNFRLAKEDLSILRKD